MDSPTATVKIDRLMAELEALAGFSDAPPPAVTRIVYTDSDLRARAFLTERFHEAGLSVRTDAIGNTFARWEGTNPERAAVATGSHIDAIPMSGRYDGTVGVLGALEAVRALKASGFRPRRPIQVIVFTSEEPTRFGVGCLGSRALSDAIAPHTLAALRDGEGRTLDEIRRACGFTEPLESVRLRPGAYAAFVELHIEQDRILQDAGVPIGVVTAIAAPAALRLTFEGPGGHAGTVLMPARSDPLPAAAATALAVESVARESGADAVGTVGILEVEPGAINSIPRRVQMTVDFRDVDLERRDTAVRRILDAASAEAGRRGVRLTVESLYADGPARSGPEVVAVIEDTCCQLRIPFVHTVSRAYHDAAFMARLCPVAMIFIPCRDGISHRPDEYASPEDIARGVEVLAVTLRRLAGGSG
jgi:N-carbamoyl-L-amino-acid hydrolase